MKREGTRPGSETGGAKVPADGFRTAPYRTGHHCALTLSPLADAARRRIATRRQPVGCGEPERPNIPSTLVLAEATVVAALFKIEFS